MTKQKKQKNKTKKVSMLHKQINKNDNKITNKYINKRLGQISQLCYLLNCPSYLEDTWIKWLSKGSIISLSHNPTFYSRKLQSVSESLYPNLSTCRILTSSVNQVWNLGAKSDFHSFRIHLFALQSSYKELEQYISYNPDSSGTQTKLFKVWQ